MAPKCFVDVEELMSLPKNYSGRNLELLFLYRVKVYPAMTENTTLGTTKRIYYFLTKTCFSFSPMNVNLF